MHHEASARIYDTLAGPGGEPRAARSPSRLHSPATAAALGRIARPTFATESELEPRLLELLELDRGP